MRRLSVFILCFSLFSCKEESKVLDTCKTFSPFYAQKVKEYLPDSVKKCGNFTDFEKYFTTECVDIKEGIELTLLYLPTCNTNVSKWEKVGSVSMIYKNEANYLIQTSFEFPNADNIRSFLSYLKQNNIIAKAPYLIHKFYRIQRSYQCKVRNLAFMESLNFRTKIPEKYKKTEWEMWVLDKGNYNSTVAAMYLPGANYPICPGYYTIQLFFWNTQTFDYDIYTVETECRRLTVDSIMDIIKEDCECENFTTNNE